MSGRGVLLLSGVFRLRWGAANRRIFAAVPLVRQVAFLVLLGISLCVFNSSQAVSAELPEKDSPPGEILFRRIFVPADRPETWPRNEQKLLPIESQDFAAWVQKANHPSHAQAALAVIRDAEYIGRLENDRLMGSGHWSVVAMGDGPVFMPLAPMSLVINDPRWREAPRQPARLGIWGQASGPAARFGLEVPRSGELGFTWYLRAKPVYGGVEMPWRTPSSMSTRLILDLPEGKHPQLDGAIVLASQLLQANADAKAPPIRRWELVVSAGPEATLRIMDANNSAVADQSMPTVRETTFYRITPRGLDIESTWRFADTADRRSELILPLPEGVQLISASAALQKLPWQTIALPPSGDKRPVVRISLEHLSEQQLANISIRSWHPLVLEKPWRLPKLRPKDVFWMSGQTALEVSEELVLRDLSNEGCVQIGAGKDEKDGRSPRRRHFADYAPDAALQVLLGERPVEAAIRVGSSLTMAEPDMSGRLVAQWESIQGTVHHISGEVAADWIIESVETQPAKALGDWFIDRNNGRHRLEIQLARPVGPDHKVTIIITGRLQRLGVRSPLSVRIMRMISWKSARVDRHLLTFQPIEPYTAEVIGNVPLVAIDTVTDEDRSLLTGMGPNEVVYDLAQASPDAGLQLVPKRGEYEAQILLDATYRHHELRQSYFIEIRPTTGRVDRVLVVATAPLGDDVRWTKAESSAALLAERLPANDPRRLGLPAAGEMWLVHLPRSVSPTARIVATLSSPWPSRKEVPLLALPEAAAQQGSVLLRVEAQETPSLEVQGVTSLAVPEESLHGTQSSQEIAVPVNAAFRYQPTDCLAPDSNVLLWLIPQRNQQMHTIIAHHADWESYYQADGCGTHRMTYRIEKREGAKSVQVSYAPGAVITGIWVNGQALEHARGKVANGFLRVALPATTRRARLLISLETKEEALAAGRKLSPPVLLRDVPLLAGEWKVWLPEEFSAVGADVVSDQPHPTWRMRLFGPLARPLGRHPFNPFHLADWLTLANPVAAEPTGLAAPQVSTSAIPQGEMPGWRSYQCRFVTESPSPIVVLHPSLISSWALVVFMVCFVLGTWLRPRGGAWFIFLLALAAGTCLLLPIAFAPLATGGFLGLLFSLVAVWPWRTKVEKDSVHRDIQLSTVGALSMVFAVSAIQPSYAENQPIAVAVEQDSPSKNIHQLFVPVDAEGRPVGSKYYVGETFLRELLRAAQDSAATGQWLIRDAEYEIELQDSADSVVPAVGQWKLKFEIEVLARDTDILLPLVQSDAEWESTVLLDGVPEPLIWQSDGRGCAVHVREPGQYSLLISCTPHTSSTSGENIVKLSVPPVMRAVVRLDSVARGAWLKINGVEMVHRNAEASTELQTELDGVDHIELRWSAMGFSTEEVQELRVVGMRWLRIGVEKVELEAKYIFEGNVADAKRSSKSFVVAFDRAWELDPRENKLSGEWEERQQEGRSIVRVPLPRSRSARQEVTLRWRLKEGPVWGRLRLPTIELLSLPVTQRWLAITSDPTLECTVVDMAAGSGNIKDFLTMWADIPDGTLPQIVLEQINPREAITLAIRPRQVESEIDETLHVAIASNRTRFVYQADVVPGSDDRYHLPLVISPELEIDQTTVTRGGERVAVEAVRAAGDRFNIFFDERIDNKYRVMISGFARAAKEGARLLPRIAAVRMRPGIQHVQLYREEDVLVDISGIAEPQAAAMVPFQPQFPWSARPFAAYRLGSSVAEQVRISTTSNHVVISGPSLITMTREANAWFAQFKGRFRVEQGQLDSLRFRVSPTWKGPYRVESNVPATVASISGDNKQHAIVSVRFEKSIASGKTVVLSIHGPLTFGAVSSAMVPEILPDPFPHGRRYVMVPAIVDDQRIDWTAVGVRLAEPPAELLDVSSGDMSPQVDASHYAFEIMTSPFRVALRPHTAPLTGRVRLADTRAYLGRHGGQLLATRLVVIPHDLAYCTLQLPEKQELISVRLDGRAALLSQRKSNEWLISVGPTHFPRVLDILTRIETAAEGDSRIVLRQARLLADGEPLPAEVALWSVGHSFESAVVRLRGVAAVASEDQVALRRLDRLTSIAEGALALVVETPLDGYGWFRAWAAWLRALKEETSQILEEVARRRLVHQVPQSFEEPFAVSSRRIDKWMQECSEVLVKAGFPRDEADQNKVLSDWPQFPLVVRRWIYSVAEDDLNQLTIEIPKAEWSARRERMAGTAVILVLAGVAFWLWRIPRISELVFRWPHAIVFGIGMVYWAWLWPSWLGIAIAATSVWLVLRCGWPGKSLPLEASTVLRSERSNQSSP